MSTIYALSANSDKIEFAGFGTLKKARKLALEHKTDIEVANRESSVAYDFEGAWAGRVYYARVGGFKLHERLYGTYYTRGRLAKLRSLWEDTVGRIEFQSPIYIRPRRVR
jgi:hypothetical protein